MAGDPLARPPVPDGYAVRLALSHHLGGWKPCAGAPKCRHCVELQRLRNKRQHATEAPPGELPASTEGDAAGLVAGHRSHPGNPIARLASDAESKAADVHGRGGGNARAAA